MSPCSPQTCYLNYVCPSVEWMCVCCLDPRGSGLLFFMFIKAPPLHLFGN